MAIPPGHQKGPLDDIPSRNTRKFSFLNGKQNANYDPTANNRHCTPKASRSLITSDQNRDGRHNNLIVNRKQIRSAYIQENRHIRPNLDISSGSTTSNRSTNIISSFKDKCVEAGISFLNNFKSNNINYSNVSPIINLAIEESETVHPTQACDETYPNDEEEMYVDEQVNDLINLEDTQNEEAAKIVQKNKVSFQPAASRQVLQKEKEKFTLKFKGSNLNSFKEFKVLLGEIKRNKPNVHIQHASVVVINNEAILYISTNDRKSLNELSDDWPKDAFKNGITLVKNNLKYFVAIRGVSRKNKLDDEDDLRYLREEYGIMNLQRIFNKEKNETTIVKAETENELQMVNAVKYGIYINNYHHKVDLWTFSPKVCYKCQGFGHFAKDCKAETSQVCKHCGGTHAFKECSVRKNKELVFCQACNIKNDHSSGDKKCPKMKIEYLKTNRSYASIVANHNLETHTSRQVLVGVQNTNKSLNSKNIKQASKEPIGLNKISNQNSLIDETIQVKVIKCIQDFFIHQTRIQDSFQKKEDTVVIKLFKRHFPSQVVDKCKDYINQSIKNENFYNQSDKSSNQAVKICVSSGNTTPGSDKLTHPEKLVPQTSYGDKEQDKSIGLLTQTSGGHTTTINELNDDISSNYNDELSETNTTIRQNFQCDPCTIQPIDNTQV